MPHALPLMLAQEDAPPLPAQAPDAAPAGPATTLQDGQAVPPAPQQQPSGGNFLFFILLMLVVFVFFSMSGQRREKKKRAAMLSNLNKGDKVQTIGGIVGNVVEVREHEVVVKVDENTNTRLRFARTAIQTVLKDADEDK